MPIYLHRPTTPSSSSLFFSSIIEQVDKCDLLILTQHNRTLGDDLKLWDAIGQQQPLTRITFTKPRKRGEKPSKVAQEINVLRYTLHPKSKHPMLLTLVQTKEINPPAGKSPLTWRLVTKRRVETADADCELIDGYRARWEIEMFRVLDCIYGIQMASELGKN